MKQSFKRLKIYILTGRKVPRADGQYFNLMSLVALDGRVVNHEGSIEKSLFYGVRNGLIPHRHSDSIRFNSRAALPFGHHPSEAPKWVEVTATLSTSTSKISDF